MKSKSGSYSNGIEINNSESAWKIKEKYSNRKKMQRIF